MSSTTPQLTAETLRKLLEYDPETGAFTWRERPELSWNDRMWNGRYAGKVAGTCLYNGRRHYGSVVVHGKRHYAHRLAWLYMTGEWPPGSIDHKDNDGTNNRWDNLRAAAPAQNAANSRRNTSNSTGYKGVRWHRRARKYEALIREAGRQRHLGYFERPKDAHEAYMSAARRIHGEFARSG